MNLSKLKPKDLPERRPGMSETADSSLMVATKDGLAGPRTVRSQRVGNARGTPLTAWGV